MVHPEMVGLSNELVVPQSVLVLVEEDTWLILKEEEEHRNLVEVQAGAALKSSLGAVGERILQERRNDLVVEVWVVLVLMVLIVEEAVVSTHSC